MWTFPDNEIPINARITFGAAWNDVDLGTNNDVPAGTKGVVLHVRNTGGSAYGCNVRFNGTTDNRQALCQTLRHGWYVIGLDADRIFEAYFENSALDICICAYTSDDRFYTTSTTFANTQNGVYEDITLTQQGAKGAWLEISGVATAYNYALRKKGSSFESYRYMGSGGTPRSFTGFSGLDTNLKAEHKVSSYTNVIHYLWGWTGEEIVALDAPVKKQADQASNWRDINCSAEVPVNARGVILQVVNTGASIRSISVRKKGSSDDKTTGNRLGASYQIFALAGLDNSQTFQAWTENTAEIELWLIGYVLPYSQAITNTGNIASAEAWGTLQMVPGPATLLPTGVPPAEDFGIPQVIPGQATLSAIGILSGEAFGIPQVFPAGSVILYPPGIPPAETCGLPTMMPAQAGTFPNNLALSLDFHRLEAAPAIRRLAAAPQITRLQVTPDA